MNERVNKTLSFTRKNELMIVLIIVNLVWYWRQQENVRVKKFKELLNLLAADAILRLS